MTKWVEGKNADYIGDGVYAMFDGYGVWLHANDHANPTDKIYLEPSVIANLNNFIERAKPNNEKK